MLAARVSTAVRVPAMDGDVKSREAEELAPRLDVRNSGLACEVDRVRAGLGVERVIRVRSVRDGVDESRVGVVVDERRAGERRGTARRGGVDASGDSELSSRSFSSPAAVDRPRFVGCGIAWGVGVWGVGVWGVVDADYGSGVGVGAGGRWVVVDKFGQWVM